MPERAQRLALDANLDTLRDSPCPCLLDPEAHKTYYSLLLDKYSAMLWLVRGFTRTLIAEGDSLHLADLELCDHSRQMWEAATAFRTVAHAVDAGAIPAIVGHVLEDLVAEAVRSGQVSRPEEATHTE